MDIPPAPPTGSLLVVGRQGQLATDLVAAGRRLGRPLVALGRPELDLTSPDGIARALDRVRHPLVVGTLAGDDTCLVVAATAEDARSLVLELS